jgi:hypothetical protein
MNIPFQSIETRWLRWLLRLSVALIILLGVLSLAAWLYLRSERFNNFVARRIERGAQDYGLRVEVGGFTPGWSARSVRLRDLRVHNQQTGQLIATIKEAELSTDIPNLFALSLERDVILKELRLSGVELQVVIDEQGQTNLAGLRQPPKKPGRIHIDASQLVTTLTDSRLVFNDQKHRLATTLEGLQAQLQTQPQTNNFKTQISATGGSFGFDQRTTTLNALNVNGTLDGAGMQIESLKLNSGFGELQARGRLDEWKALRYSLEVETRNDLAETLRVFAPQIDLNGALKAQGQVEGSFAAPIRGL